MRTRYADGQFCVAGPAAQVNRVGAARDRLQHLLDEYTGQPGQTRTGAETLDAKQRFANLYPALLRDYRAAAGVPSPPSTAHDAKASPPGSSTSRCTTAPAATTCAEPTTASPPRSRPSRKSPRTEPPTRTSTGASLPRWVGIDEYRGGDFESHCVVMAGERCLFDPVSHLPAQPPPDALEHISYSISIGRK
jgi:hypothetical protein